MAKRKKNILFSMSAQEKRFIRKIEVVLKAEGVNKHEMPEQKREALEHFRQRRQRKCARIVNEVINDLVADEKSNGTHTKSAKPAKE